MELNTQKMCYSISKELADVRYLVEYVKHVSTGKKHAHTRAMRHPKFTENLHKNCLIFFRSYI